jgi:hypothetical protein
MRGVYKRYSIEIPNYPSERTAAGLALKYEKRAVAILEMILHDDLANYYLYLPFRSWHISLGLGSR